MSIVPCYDRVVRPFFSVKHIGRPYHTIPVQRMWYSWSFTLLLCNCSHEQRLSSTYVYMMYLSITICRLDGMVDLHRTLPTDFLNLMSTRVLTSCSSILGGSGTINNTRRREWWRVLLSQKPFLGRIEHFTQHMPQTEIFSYYYHPTPSIDRRQ